MKRHLRKIETRSEPDPRPEALSSTLSAALGCALMKRNRSGCRGIGFGVQERKKPPPFFFLTNLPWFDI